MTPHESWRRACERLEALGEKIAEREGPEAERGLLEDFEHLVDQTVLWLAWETLHADPSRPFFHRHNDLTSQWGGPNNDNVYRHARVDPARRYVVRGRMHSCEDFILAARAGFMHDPVWGTLVQVTASERGIGPGDDFELHFGGDHPAAIELPAGVIMLSIREYYFDWKAEEPAVVTIECLDPEPWEAPDAAAFGAQLDRSLDEVEQSIRYWDDYMVENRAARTDNSFTAATTTVGKGLSMARYEFCFWDLEADEALLIECDEPDARYWSVHLYMLRSFEPVDPYAAITSRNHLQSEASADGRFRFVVSAVDPGVANWLDPTGRRNGLCTIRWFWPHSDARPALSTRVVPVASVATELPADTRAVSTQQRAEELAARQAHLRWRFRT